MATASSTLTNLRSQLSRVRSTRSNRISTTKKYDPKKAAVIKKLEPLIGAEKVDKFMEAYDLLSQSPLTDIKSKIDAVKLIGWDGLELLALYMFGPAGQKAVRVVRFAYENRKYVIIAAVAIAILMLLPTLFAVNLISSFKENPTDAIEFIADNSSDIIGDKDCRTTSTYLADLALRKSVEALPIGVDPGDPDFERDKAFQCALDLWEQDSRNARLFIEDN